MPMRFALASIAAPSAMSDVDRPRCHSRMVSPSLSRAGFAAADDLAQLGVQRRLGQLAGIDVRAQAAELAASHCPQSSTTILSMMSVSESSTALIVP